MCYRKVSVTDHLGTIARLCSQPQNSAKTVPGSGGDSGLHTEVPRPGRKCTLGAMLSITESLAN